MQLPPNICGPLLRLAPRLVPRIRQFETGETLCYQTSTPKRRFDSSGIFDWRAPWNSASQRQETLRAFRAVQHAAPKNRNAASQSWAIMATGHWSVATHPVHFDLSPPPLHTARLVCSLASGKTLFLASGFAEPQPGGGCQLHGRPPQAALLRVRDLTVQLATDTGAAIPVVEAVSFDIAAGGAVGIP